MEVESDRNVRSSLEEALTTGDVQRAWMGMGMRRQIGRLGQVSQD